MPLRVYSEMKRIKRPKVENHSERTSCDELSVVFLRSINVNADLSWTRAWLGSKDQDFLEPDRSLHAFNRCTIR